MLQRMLQIYFDQCYHYYHCRSAEFNFCLNLWAKVYMSHMRNKSYSMR